MGKELGYVWMMPKGAAFQELTAKIKEWPDTRALIDVIGFADHGLYNLYSDATLRNGFAALNESGLPLALEVGAVKEWENGRLGSFREQKPMWDKFISLGANIFGIAMDEPLVNVLAYDKYDYLGDIEAKFEYAVERTALFIKKVREDYPHWVIGDIEVFPHFTADFVIRWIDALEARLKKKGIKGQDFFRMDVNWAAFTSKNFTWEQGWLEVKRIEDHCRSIGMPFSQIYWAADVPGSQELKDDPASWFNGIMHMGQGYREAGGIPDQYVIETWIGLPEKSLPETDPHSFTYSVVEFSKQFIPRK